MLPRATIRRRAAVLAVALLGVCGPPSYTACRSSDGATASAPDSGAPDVVAVKPGDAAIRDAFVSDAALPPERWERIPGLPDRCGERVARAPNEAIPPLVFAPCTSGRSGCTRMMADWNRSGGIGGYEAEPMRRLASGVYFTYSRDEKPSSKTSIASLVVQRASGERVFAIALAPNVSGDDCVLRGAVSDYGVAVQALGIEGEYDVGVAASPDYQSLALTKLPFSVLDPKNGGVVMEAFGSTGVAYYRNEGTSSLYDFRTKQAKTVTVDGFAWTPWGEGALTFGSDGSSALPTNIGYLAPDGTLTKLVDPGPGRLVAAMAVDRGVTPNQLVWIEGADAGFGLSSSEIWTGPLGTTPGAVPRRLVAKTPRGHGMLKPIAADRGRMVMLEGRSSARVVRLSDGRGWRIDAEPGEGIPDVIGFDDDNVWVSIVEDDPAFSNLGFGNGILRLRLDSLGEPSLPNGL